MTVEKQRRRLLSDWLLRTLVAVGFPTMQCDVNKDTLWSDCFIFVFTIIWSFIKLMAVVFKIQMAGKDFAMDGKKWWDFLPSFFGFGCRAVFFVRGGGGESSSRIRLCFTFSSKGFPNIWANYASQQMHSVQKNKPRIKISLLGRLCRML